MTTILIQDDPGLFRDLEDSALRREDLRVLIAANAGALVERCRRERPDLVILCARSLGDACDDVVRALQESVDSPPATLVSDVATNRHDLAARVSASLGLQARSELRRACRLPVRTRCGDQERDGTTRDLCQGGVFVATRWPYPRGSQVGLRFVARRPGPGHSASGRVVRSLDADREPSRLPGMAVSFHRAERLASAVVDALVAASGSAE